MRTKDIAIQKDIVARKPRGLFIDIETLPNVVETWGVYEQNSLRVIKDWTICCVGMKWLDEKEVHVFALPDFPGYRKGSRDDSKLTGVIWDYLDKADFVIAHNGDNFDIKKINARLLVHKHGAPSPYFTVDTKKVAKRHFGFDSNKLNELGRQLKIGQKVQTGGYTLWVKCEEGDPQAWKRMKEYNRQDVLLLEKVYLRMRGWHKTHPNLNFFERKPLRCKTCLSEDIHRRGQCRLKSGWKQRYNCLSCGAWNVGDIIKNTKVAIT